MATRSAYTVTTSEYALRTTPYGSASNWWSGPSRTRHRRCTTPTTSPPTRVTAGGSTPPTAAVVHDHIGRVRHLQHHVRRVGRLPQEQPGTGGSWTSTTQADFDLHESAGRLLRWLSEGPEHVERVGRRRPRPSTTTTRAARAPRRTATRHRRRTRTSPIPTGTASPSFEERRNDAILTHMITGVRPLANGTYADGTPKLTGGPGVPLVQEVER